MIMEIRFLRTSETDLYESSKALWQECFFDDSSFVEYYFKYRTRPECILACIDNDGVQGMVHMLPKYLNVSGELYPVTLIAGLCVKPSVRRGGIASRIMHSAMKLSDTYAIVLQPASESLFCFYERFGFQPLCRCFEITVEKNSVKAPFGGFFDANAMQSIYDRFVSGFNTYEHRTKLDFQMLFNEYSLDRSFIAHTDSAYALCTDGDGLCTVSELCGEMSEELINRISAVTACERIRFLTMRPIDKVISTENVKQVNFNMIKVLKKLPELKSICSFMTY